MVDEKSTQEAGPEGPDPESSPGEHGPTASVPEDACTESVGFPRDPEDSPGLGDSPGTGEIDPAAEPGKKKRFAIGGWIERHTKRAVSRMYESRADEIEERARRAVGSAYRDQADDIQDRAIRAMRIAIAEEADRIKEAIEHGVEIKKREVRLSLLVLVTASLVYLVLYWLTQTSGAAS